MKRLKRKEHIINESKEKKKERNRKWKNKRKFKEFHSILQDPGLETMTSSSLCSRLFDTPKNMRGSFRYVEKINNANP